MRSSLSADWAKARRATAGATPAATANADVVWMKALLFIRSIVRRRLGERVNDVPGRDFFGEGRIKNFTHVAHDEVLPAVCLIHCGQALRVARQLHAP